jgi:hypothetical protein
MTDTDRAGPGRAGPPPCAQLAGGLLARYASGALDAASAWSVEAHVPDCGPCRAALAGQLDAARLARNRAVLLTRLAVPPPGPVGGALRWCGVPDHVVALLSATPSLVLAAAVGAAYLLVPDAPARLSGDGAWAGLMPFLAVAPLVPLAAVAAAFSPRLDPAYEIAAAAPISAVWLLFVRATAVIAVTLVPTALAALALPGPWWLASVLLLPALAVSAAALAAATVVGPAAAAAGAGTAWIAAVTAATVARHPAAAFGPAGQAAAAAVLLAAVAVLAARRDRFSVSRTRKAGQ